MLSYAILCIGVFVGVLLLKLFNFKNKQIIYRPFVFHKPIVYHNVDDVKTRIHVERVCFGNGERTRYQAQIFENEQWVELMIRRCGSVRSNTARAKRLYPFDDPAIAFQKAKIDTFIEYIKIQQSPTIYEIIEHPIKTEEVQPSDNSNTAKN